MSDEQKRPSADTNCRGVDGDVGQGKGEKNAKSEERKREIAGRRGGG